MRIIKGLTSEPNQKFQMTIAGVKAFFELVYRPAVQMWFISLDYGDFSMKNMRLCANYNLFGQYINKLQFGLWVRATGRDEPFLINDFSTGRISLNLLNADEVLQMESFIQDG